MHLQPAALHVHPTPSRPPTHRIFLAPPCSGSRDAQVQTAVFCYPLRTHVFAKPQLSPVEIDRYIGYWEPHATNHAALDLDTDILEEVRNAARMLTQAVMAMRSKTMIAPGAGLTDPRQK